jgi:ComF family protein
MAAGADFLGSLSTMRAAARAAGRFLFPTSCVACGVGKVESFFRGGVCAPCWESLPRPDPNRCDRCDETLPAFEASRCGRCLLEPPPFERLIAAAPYRGTARSILLAFKFRGAESLDRHLAARMADALPLAGEGDEIVSVPSRPGARRRPPHAATLLARALARRLGLRFCPERLSKRRDTERQSRLPLALRAGNVRGAFQAHHPVARRVLLVDDVATSGATARECASALLAAGAREVNVCCFARASRTDVRIEPPDEVALAEDR